MNFFNTSPNKVLAVLFRICLRRYLFVLLKLLVEKYLGWERDNFSYFIAVSNEVNFRTPKQS